MRSEGLSLLRRQFKGTMDNAERIIDLPLYGPLPSQ
jgi:hypothetical protein